MDGLLKSLKTILREQGPYEIPRFQRGYAWRASEAADLWNDLQDAQESKEPLFLGTLLTQVEHEDGPVFIVDGQQRITTLLLLLIAVRQHAKHIEQSNIVAVTQEALTYRDPATGLDTAFRLTASPKIRDIFAHMCASSWNGSFPDRVGDVRVRAQAQRLRPVYDFFAGKLKDNDATALSSLLSTIYSAKAVHVTVKSLSEAISVFERTNARGTDLEVADLLKNHLIGSSVEGIDSRWDSITKRADGQLLRMLKYFYVSQKGYTPNAKLYAGIKTLYPSAPTLVEELERFASFFATVRAPSRDTLVEWGSAQEFGPMVLDEVRAAQLAGACEALVGFRHMQFFPLLYAALQTWQRHASLLSTDASLDVEKQRKKLRPLVDNILALADALERFHFVNSTICGRAANEVERLYADSCTALRTSASVNATVTELQGVIAALRKKRAPLDEFRPEFTALCYDDAPQTLYYIFDRMNNFHWETKKWLHPDQRLRAFNIRERAGRRSWTLEHFYPQKPKGTAVAVDENEIPIHNIGNLMLLQAQPNNDLSNNLPLEKVSLLSTTLETKVQNTAEVRRFLQKYGPAAGQWGKSAIEGRANDLATECYEIVFAF